MAEESIIPFHKWTHTGDKVRILKLVDKDGRGHGGFQWPESGPVTPRHWSREATCESGGLFGWAWGLCFGDGKEPEYLESKWIVFEAHPEDVISIPGGKVKAVPNPDANRTPHVLYCGTYHGANQLLVEGQIAWCRQASRGAASNTGHYSSASTSGYGSSASNSGKCSSASNSGDRSSASNSGYGSSASNSGYGSSASNTGHYSSASNSGKRSIAALTGNHGTIEGAATGIACCTADRVTWDVVEGCLLLLRWEGGHRLVTAGEINAKTGDRVTFVKGIVVEHSKSKI